MKIVHCIYSFNTGGAETMLVDIANEQAKTQDVTIIIVNDSFQQNLIDTVSEKVKIIFNHRKPNSRSIWPIIKLNWILWRLRPEVVHIHNATLTRIILPFISHGLFLTVHALYIPLECIRHGTKLIAISEAVKKDILNRGKYDVVTIPNGIVINTINKRDTNFHLHNGKMRIVQVARLDSSKKGQDILINAIAKLKERGITNVEVDFIGEGESKQMLHELACQKDVSKQIHFLGLRNREYIYANLKNYDLMCHPSRYEGFGLTVVEGMAAMLPVLVSNDGGPYEIIKYGKYGYAFQTGNAIDCADKLEDIYHNYSQTKEIAIHAYQYIVENFSIKRMSADYIQAYKLHPK